MEFPDPWPLRHLSLRTPRLELRPDDDAGLLELIEEAHRGVHPPEQMPFRTPWTDAPRAELGANMLRMHWGNRAAMTPESWGIQFLVRCDGRVIGSQHLGAERFAVTGECVSGSWVGLRHQGNGIGTEMRAAVAAFAFDHLGARTLRSVSWQDNAVARAVSEKLGYVEDGTERHAVRGEPATGVRYVLTPQRFRRPDWTLRVHGLAAARVALGAENRGQVSVS